MYLGMTPRFLQLPWLPRKSPSITPLIARWILTIALLWTPQWKISSSLGGEKLAKQLVFRSSQNGLPSINVIL